MASWPEAVPFVPQLLLQRAPGAPRHWEAEATMVLLDFSGFTALSEQLARQGRVALGGPGLDLDPALHRAAVSQRRRRRRGEVRGRRDADHVRGPRPQLHACHAASAIQRLLQVVGAVHLAGARARLRMSVGVHTGRFEFLLTGGQHQNLVVAGPALDLLLQLQDEAEAGQILVSPERRPRPCRHPLPERLVARASCSAGCRRSSLGRIDGRSGRGPLPDIARYLPAAFAERPDLLVADSDHRRAAMGFVQVTGLGRLLDSGDPLARLDQLTSVVEDACRQTGVTLLDTDICPRRLPLLRDRREPRSRVEDPEGRLLRALVQITTADSDLGVRAGAASGQVFAGPVGAPFRRTFSVMGDTTNLAARLTARAPQRQVLAHAPVLARSRTLFTTEDQAPITVKGKAEPLQVVHRQRCRGAPRPGRRRAAVRRPRPGARRDLGGAGVGPRGCRGDPGRGRGRGPARPGSLARRSLASGLSRRRGRRGLLRRGRPVQHPGDGCCERCWVSAPRILPRTSPRALTLVVSERAPELTGWLALLSPAVGAGSPTTPAVDELDERFRVARVHDTVRALLMALLADTDRAPHRRRPVGGRRLERGAGGGRSATQADRPWRVLLTRQVSEAGLHGSDTMPARELRLAPDAAGRGPRAGTSRSTEPRSGGWRRRQPGRPGRRQPLLPSRAGRRRRRSRRAARTPWRSWSDCASTS